MMGWINAGVFVLVFFVGYLVGWSSGTVHTFNLFKDVLKNFIDNIDKKNKELDLEGKE